MPGVRLPIVEPAALLERRPTTCCSSRGTSPTRSWRSRRSTGPAAAASSCRSRNRASCDGRRTTERRGMGLAAGSGAAARASAGSSSSPKLEVSPWQTAWSGNWPAVCDGIVAVVPADVGWSGDPVDSVVEGGNTRASSCQPGSPRCRRVAHPWSCTIPRIPWPRRSGCSSTSLPRFVRERDAAAPGLPLVEPLKRIASDRSVIETPSRESTVMLQTPHAFRADVLRRAHADEPQAAEETELVELHGGRVVIVPGELVELPRHRTGSSTLVERLLAQD